MTFLNHNGGVFRKSPAAFWGYVHNLLILSPVRKSIWCNVNNALENQTGQDWYRAELFTPYQIDMLHICVCLTKET